MSNDTKSISAFIYKKGNNQKQLARISLNGYNIKESAQMGHGAMRSFKLKQGDLWGEWSTREQLDLITQDGQESRIRIAAHPAGEDATGLIEFI